MVKVKMNLLLLAPSAEIADVEKWWDSTWNRTDCCAGCQVKELHFHLQTLRYLDFSRSCLLEIAKFLMCSQNFHFLCKEILRDYSISQLKILTPPSSSTFSLMKLNQYNDNDH